VDEFIQVEDEDECSEAKVDSQSSDTDECSEPTIESPAPQISEFTRNGLSKAKKKKQKRTANFGFEVTEPDNESLEQSLEESESEKKLKTKPRRRREKSSTAAKGNPIAAKSTREGIRKDESSGHQPYRCERCGSQFQSKTKLFKHLDSNPSHKSFK
jgi:hypothetical protein